MRDHRRVEPEIEAHRPSIAKPPPGRDGHKYTGSFGRRDRLAIDVRDLSFRIQCRAVEVEGEEFYH